MKHDRPWLSEKDWICSDKVITEEQDVLTTAEVIQQ
jgi:hypothetical protein